MLEGLFANMSYYIHIEHITMQTLQLKEYQQDAQYGQNAQDACTLIVDLCACQGLQSYQLQTFTI